MSRATHDDGSCQRPRLMCTDRAASNFMASAPVVLGSAATASSFCRFGGCTDKTAANFAPAAAFDDGSCKRRAAPLCTESAAIDYASRAAVGGGQCTFAGCTRRDATNFDSRASVDDGSCTAAPPGAATASPSALPLVQRLRRARVNGSVATPRLDVGDDGSWHGGVVVISEAEMQLLLISEAEVAPLLAVALPTMFARRAASKGGGPTRAAGRQPDSSLPPCCSSRSPLPTRTSPGVGRAGAAVRPSPLRGACAPSARSLRSR